MAACSSASWTVRLACAINARNESPPSSSSRSTNGLTKYPIVSASSAPSRPTVGAPTQSSRWPLCRYNSAAYAASKGAKGVAISRRNSSFNRAVSAASSTRSFLPPWYVCTGGRG